MIDDSEKNCLGGGTPISAPARPAGLCWASHLGPRRAALRRAKRAGFFGVLGPPFEAKSLKTLVESTFRRAKRAGFFGVLDPLLETNTSKHYKSLA